MMKRCIAAVLAIGVAAMCCLADETTPPKRTRPKRSAAPSGGIVEKEYTGKVARIVNAQSAVAPGKVAALTRDIRLTSLLPFETVERSLEGSPFEAASAEFGDSSVGACILLVEDPSLPPMLVAPECRWTILNISFLKSDCPAPEVLEERFGKVLWCAAARTLGAGYSSYKPCVLEPFSDLRGLDRICTSKPCPEPFNKMIDTGAALGIRTLTIASYRTACTQGWAPPPTNDVQRAIWEQVSADKERGPTNTRPIKFKGRRPPRP